MRAAGVFLISGVGSLGVIVSSLLLKRILRGASKGRQPQDEDDDAKLGTLEVPQYFQDEGSLVLPEAATTLLKESGNQNDSERRSDSDGCAVTYDDRTCDPDNPESVAVGTSLDEGCTTESASLHAADFVGDLMDHESLTEDEFSQQFDDAPSTEQSSVVDGATSPQAVQRDEEDAPSLLPQPGTDDGPLAQVSQTHIVDITDRFSYVPAQEARQTCTALTAVRPLNSNPRLEVDLPPSSDPQVTPLPPLCRATPGLSIELPSTSPNPTIGTVVRSPSLSSAALSPMPAAQKAALADICAAPFSSTQIQDDDVNDLSAHSAAILVSPERAPTSPTPVLPPPVSSSPQLPLSPSLRAVPVPVVTQSLPALPELPPTPASLQAVNATRVTGAQGAREGAREGSSEGAAQGVSDVLGTSQKELAPAPSSSPVSKSADAASMWALEGEPVAADGDKENRGMGRRSRKLGRESFLGGRKSGRIEGEAKRKLFSGRLRMPPLRTRKWNNK